MKKRGLFLLAALVILPCMVFAACGKKHTTHTYGTTWQKNAQQHWYDCTNKKCNEKKDAENHTASDWIVDEVATATTPGSKYKECEVCKYEIERQEIPAAGTEHTHGFTVETRNANTLKAAATCEVAATYWYSCQCGTISTTVSFTYGSPLAHIYGDWQSNASQHWKKCSCGDTKDTASHTGDPCVCGYTTPTVPPCTHQYGEWQKDDADNHSRVCECEHKDTAPHTWNAGVPTAAPHQLKHTCTTCDEEKTVTGTHNFNVETVNETTRRSIATCEVAATYWYSCACTEKSSTIYFSHSSVAAHSHGYGLGGAKPWEQSCACGHKTGVHDYTKLDNPSGMIALFEELTYDGNYKISIECSTSGGLDYTGDIEVNGKNSYADFPDGSTEYIYKRYMQNIDETTTTQWYYDLFETWTFTNGTYNTWNYYGGGIILTKNLTANNFDVNGEYSTPASYSTIYTIENCEITFNQNNIVIVMDNVGSGWSTHYEYTITLGTSMLTEQDILENVDHPSLMFGIVPDLFNQETLDGYDYWWFFYNLEYLDQIEEVLTDNGWVRTDYSYLEPWEWPVSYADGIEVYLEDDTMHIYTIDEGRVRYMAEYIHKTHPAMMFGIMPFYFADKGDDSYSWMFDGVEKVDEFAALMVDQGWLLCDCGGTCGDCIIWSVGYFPSGADGTAKFQGTNVNINSPNEAYIWFGAVDGSGYRVYLTKVA